jgi:hypothetical protein
MPPTAPVPAETIEAAPATVVTAVTTYSAADAPAEDWPNQLISSGLVVFEVSGRVSFNTTVSQLVLLANPGAHKHV